MISADSVAPSIGRRWFRHNVPQRDTHGKSTAFPIMIVACFLLWLGALGLVQGFGPSVPSQTEAVLSPTYAVHFMLLGTALLLARSRPAAARALALVIVVSSACHGIFDALGASTADAPQAFDTPREFRGSVTLLISFLSVALVGSTLGSRVRKAVRWLTPGLIFLALVVRIQPGLLRLESNVDDAANLELLSVILSACAIISLSRHGRAHKLFGNRSVARTVVLGSLAAVVAWYALTDSARSSRKERAEQVSNFAVQAVSRAITENLDILKRMTLRWDSVGAMPKTNVIQQELRSYLGSIDTVDLVAVVAPDGTLQQHEKTNVIGPQWLEQQLTDPRFGAMLEQAHRESTVQVGLVGDNTVIAAPLTAASLRGWSIVAFHDSPVFISHALGAESGPIKIRIRQDDRLIYYGIRPGADASYISQTTMPVLKNHVWELSSWYERPGVPSLESLAPDLVLLICLLFTYLLSRSESLASALLARSAALKHAATHDALTGLPNLLHLQERLRRTCSTASGTSETVWVILLDLDGIRLINSSMGQSAGDRVLYEVARRLTNEAGGQAFLASLKGNEFVVVTSNDDEAAVLDLTARMLEAIASPYFIDGSELTVSATAGLTKTRENLEGPLELIREAYLAMAHAKVDGQRKWLRYSESLNKALVERMALRSNLQLALDTDVLQLHYQPLVDGQTGRIVSAEALLRWPDPERGFISPALFIPLAEETGMIVRLTRWVLERTCRDINALRAGNLLDFPLQINISPLHFQRDDFIDDIRSRLTRHSIPGHCLAIEITEGSMVGNAPGSIAKLEQLRALGIKVAIDDFGTGYSSLSYLKNLPVDKIKIDKSFVTDVVSNHRDASLVKAIIALAHNLGVRVVAEGVETESQFWFLRRNSCDEFQGWLFARPMRLNDFSSHLLERGSRETLPQAHSRADAARTLLLVDDEPNILRALNRVLRRDGYRILTARTPQDAFTLLAENDVHVIVSDQRMPAMTGTEFFRSIKQMYPDTVRLILSGYTDLKSVTEAVNHGAIYKFLVKPWDDEILRAEIAQAFRVAGARVS